MRLEDAWVEMDMPGFESLVSGHDFYSSGSCRLRPQAEGALFVNKQTRRILFSSLPLSSLPLLISSSPYVSAKILLMHSKATFLFDLSTSCS